MTWYCRNCQENNPEKVDRCRSCAKHWSEVWTKPAKRRSRSKSARGATSYKGANNKGQQEEQVDWSLFPEKVPTPLEAALTSEEERNESWSI